MYTAENTRALTFGERREFAMGAPMTVEVVYVEGKGHRVPQGCVACGKPSPTEFCTRAECLSYGSGACAPGPSMKGV